ncbi:MAG TPA: 30S ribosomal protein S20 [Candidatus Pacearchaeota archaeon]|nr:30S ribosomal protein S20 [Candidatus Parcubacteria bacterium]HNP79552.1 30S ribosomal protein S20 [Candidatus Pacearchaeota archaeon]
MPIKKSAKKQLRQSLKRKKGNDSRKKEMKELLKQANILAKEGKKEEVAKMLPKIYKAIDKAVKTGVLKKNTGSRRKAVIAKKA